MPIVYLQNKDIDRVKWDSCVRDAYNSSFYAYSWYLDIMCAKWDALVSGDYVSIMPLPISQYMGAEIVNIPFFVENLGIIATEKLNSEIEKAFLKALPRKIKYLEIPINSFNKFNYTIPHLEKKEFPRYKFDLITDYQKLYKQVYSSNFRGKFTDAIKSGLEIEQRIDTQVFLDFVRDNNNGYTYKHDDQFYRLQTLVKTLVKYGLGHVVACFYNKQLCAAGFFMYYQNCAVFSMYAENADGEKLNAANLVLDAYIRDNTIKNITLEINPRANNAINTLVNELNLEKYVSETIKLNRFSLPYKLLMRKKLI